MFDHLTATSSRIEHRMLVDDLEAIAPALDGVAARQAPDTSRAYLGARVIHRGRHRLASTLQRAAIAIAPDHVLGGHGSVGR
jgi:hypothetical protein